MGLRTKKEPGAIPERKKKACTFRREHADYAAFEQLAAMAGLSVNALINQMLDLEMKEKPTLRNLGLWPREFQV